MMFLSLVIMLTLSKRLDAARVENKTSRSNFGIAKLPALTNSAEDNHDTGTFLLKNGKQRKRQKRGSTPMCWTYSCKSRLGKNTFPIADDARNFCYCDNLCQVMQDCCHDYHLHNITDELSASEVKSKWSCVHFGKNLPIWMKVSCAENWENADVSSRCLNAPQVLDSTSYAEFIPVVGQDNITYRNQFCAICNNQNKFSSWDLQLDFYPPGVSTVRELVDFLVGYYEEKINNVVVPKSLPRRYCLQPVSTCKGHDDIVNKCLFGKVGIVYDSNGEQEYIQYKNTDCGLCNGVAKDKLKCGPEYKGVGGSKNFPEKDLEKYDFYITINFRNSEATRFTASSYCKTNVFDNHLKTCVEESDLVSPQKSPLDKYKIAVWLVADQLPGGDFSYFIAQWISDVSPSNIHSAKSKDLNKVPATYLLTFEVDLTFTQTLDLTKNVSGQQRAGTYSIKKFIQPFSGVFDILVNGSNAGKVVKTTYRRLACFGLKTYNSSEYVKVGNKIFVNETERYYSEEEYFKSSSNNGVVNVCEQQLPNECHGQYMKYNRSEFDVVKDNLSLYYRSERRLYNYNEYSVKSDTIFICNEISELDGGDGIRGLITVILMSLSVVSLFCVLITYSIFSQLRSPPGKNLMNLALSLLVFGILWLTRGWTVSTRPLCIAVAFIQSYFILVSLSSMSKIAHDTMGMFADPIGHQRRNSSSFVRFLLTWLIPVVYIAMCVILRQYNVLAVNDAECWITGTYESIVVFVPVCISMFYNILCFTRSIREMRKLERNGQMLRAQKQEKSSMFIYIKISTLIGLGWTSAFLAIAFPVLSYVFIFLTSFQGLYIFLAFVCNRNVLMLYKRLCSGKSNSHQMISMRGSLARSTVSDRL
jgi:hypothetical protein